jgi:hypothetical protein
MARSAKRHTRRDFLKKSAVLTAGAASTLSFAAPAIGQRPKLNYWCYQFLKESDDARANFAREWAQKNNVDLQITMVPLKEFLPKIHRGHRGQGHAGHRRVQRGRVAGPRPAARGLRRLQEA